MRKLKEDSIHRHFLEKLLTEISLTKTVKIHSLEMKISFRRAGGVY